jgi:peptide subunit release factor 1 (eRF1)
VAVKRQNAQGFHPALKAIGVLTLASESQGAILPISEPLDLLAAFEPTALPVVSLYLNTQSDKHGRDNFAPFVRKELDSFPGGFALRSPERLSMERDAERIHHYLDHELKPSANGLAIFACAGKADFFLALPLDAPLERNQLYVGDQPHLYTLARLYDQHRRFAVVIADTNYARIFVFGLMKTIGQEKVESRKISRTQVGGWSQARYQRHARNYHLHHAKEIVEALERIVREEDIEQIVFAGDEVIIPVLREHLPEFLAQKVIDVLRLDIRTPEHEILAATIEAMREQDARDDIALVKRLFNEYRAGGLGVVGLGKTIEALKNGQVDELLLSASMKEIRGDSGQDADVFTSDELVTRATQTGAEVRFIEDPSLLAEVGGVGAMLRFRQQGFQQ